MTIIGTDLIRGDIGAGLIDIILGVIRIITLITMTHITTTTAGVIPDIGVTILTIRGITAVIIMMIPLTTKNVTGTAAVIIWPIEQFNAQRKQIPLPGVH